MAWVPRTAHSLPFPQWGSGGSRQGPGPTGFVSWRLEVGSPPLAAAAGVRGAGSGGRGAPGREQQICSGLEFRPGPVCTGACGQIFPASSNKIHPPTRPPPA